MSSVQRIPSEQLAVDGRKHVGVPVIALVCPVTACSRPFTRPASYLRRVLKQNPAAVFCCSDACREAFGPHLRRIRRGLPAEPVAYRCSNPACGKVLHLTPAEWRKRSERNPNYQPTCSLECLNARQRGVRRSERKPKRTAPCVWCQTPVTRTVTWFQARERLGQQTFACSMRCARLQQGSLRETEVVVLSCAYDRCGRQFERPAYRWRGDQAKNPGAPSYCTRNHGALARGQVIQATRPREWLTLVCEQCGMEFNREASVQRAIRRRQPEGSTNCSQGCRVAAYSTWARSPEGQAALSERALESLANGSMPTISSQELAVGEVLDALELVYESQVTLRDPATGRFFACVDFLLEGQYVLEVYGRYWHADPRHYSPSERNATQQRVVAGDETKQRRCAALGIPHAVVWEDDVNSDAERAVSTALKQLGLEFGGGTALASHP